MIVIYSSNRCRIFTSFRPNFISHLASLNFCMLIAIYFLTFCQFIFSRQPSENSSWHNVITFYHFTFFFWQIPFTSIKHCSFCYAWWKLLSWSSLIINKPFIVLGTSRTFNNLVHNGVPYSSKGTRCHEIVGSLVLYGKCYYHCY